MGRVTLLGIAAALVVAPALALSVGSEDDTSSITLTEVRTVADPSEAAFELGAGAGSAEPQEAVEEDEASTAHQKWVSSIWNTP